MTRALYQTLGVPEDASTDAIKSAYRALAMKHHPDKGGSAEEFGQITLAYDVLSDPDRRKLYDETGVTGAPSEDDAQSRALSIVAAVLDSVLSTIDAQGVDPEMVDIVGQAEAGLRSQLAQLAQKKRDTKIAMDRKRKVLARFKAKPGKTNRIRPFIETQARAFEMRLHSLTLEETSHEAALAILLDHEFEVSAPWQDPHTLAAFMQQSRAYQP